MNEKESHNIIEPELSFDLKQLNERIINKQPMSLSEWQQTLKTLYGTINYSKIPEEQNRTYALNPLTMLC